MISVNDLSINQILDIKERVAAGEYQHVVAASYGINQGRVNEIVKGRRFADITTRHHHTSKRKSKPFRLPKGVSVYG